MAKGLKALAQQTAIYGMSSIIGRFLNYLLVPLYTLKLSAASGGYGVVTNVYALTALLLVMLTYGMETGFFRFVNKKEEDAEKVYATVLIAVGVTSLIFVTLCLLFLPQVAAFLGYADHPEFIGMMAVVVGMDAFQSIPFAHLRYKNRPLQFAFYKLLFIVLNISLNLFFFIGAPIIYQQHPELISWFYHPSYGVGYVFVANIICTSLVMLLFLPRLLKVHYVLDIALLKRILRYSLPILILGLSGILNQTIDKILFPFIMGKTPEATQQLGIYGAASKVAMIMVMFIQAFRYAYEPYVFSKSNDKDSKRTYAQAMKFFIIFALLAFLLIVFYLDIIRYLIAPDYWAGLRVVPIVMGAGIFMGINFNLSFWYKLIDKTKWGAYFSLMGCTVIIALNIVFVPHYGYMACAWASFVGYFLVMLLSYLVGQKKYPIAYPLKEIACYAGLALVLYVLNCFLLPEQTPDWLLYVLRTFSIVLFIAYIIRNDLPLKKIPIVNRWIK